MYKIQNLRRIDNEISGNVGKTISLFSRLGVNLLSIDKFNDNKDIISSIVTQRNDVVHHIDDVIIDSYPLLISDRGCKKSCVYGN